MLDANEVTAQATDGHVKRLAQRRDVSLTRMYEILSKDNPYPKAKRLIRDIAAVNRAGYQLVKADLLALFVELDGNETPDVTAAEMHEELSEAVQAELEEKPSAERLKENREAMATLAKKNQQIEREATNSVQTLRQCAKQTIAGRK